MTHTLHAGGHLIAGCINGRLADQTWVEVSRAQRLCQQPWHDAARKGGQSEGMNEVKRGSAPAVLSQKPPNPLVDGVGNFLKPLLFDGKFIAERDACIVQKHAEHAAPMHDAVELDELEDFLARLAMEGQTQQRFPNLHHGSGREIVEVVAIDHNVFAQIAGVEAQFGRDEARGVSSGLILP
jgi:hypothetical protein